MSAKLLPSTGTGTPSLGEGVPSTSRTGTGTSLGTGPVPVGTGQARTLDEPKTAVSRLVRRRLESLRDRRDFLSARATRREDQGLPAGRDRAEEAALRWALGIVGEVLTGRGFAAERRFDDYEE
jgi:hypothetical protein